MVFTNNQRVAFFEDADQCGLSNRTRLKLVAEGITNVEDMTEFEDEDWDNFAYTCKRPPQVADANGALVNVAPYELPVMSLRRLKVASELIRFYTDTGRTLSAANLMWNTVGKNFEVQWKALKTAAKKDSNDVPKLTATSVITNWFDSFVIFLDGEMGVRKSPLSYVVRENEVVPAAEPVLVAGQPHSVLYGSVKADMIARISHTHALFKDDNDKVYQYLEEATRGTKWAATIKPFKRTRHGRGAYFALQTHHAGDDKWDAVIESTMTQLAKKWDGNTATTLEQHIDRIKHAYIDQETAAEHVPHQMATARTRVKDLLASIAKCTDPAIQAAIASINQPANNMQDDFEAACRTLLPVCPVAKRLKSARKRGKADISAVGGDLKVGTTPSGHEVRYYVPNEWWQFTDDERAEIEAARALAGMKSGDKSGKKKQKKSGGKKVSFAPGAKKFKKKLKRSVSAAIKQHKKEQKQKEDDLAEISSIISGLTGASNADVAAAKSAANKNSDKSSNKDDLAMAAAVKINEIIKRKSKSS